MLTDANIKKLKLPAASQKAADKYSFGHGLRLFVYANGKKMWFIEYRHEGVLTFERTACNWYEVNSLFETMPRSLTYGLFLNLK